MRKRYAIFMGGENCWANLDGNLGSDKKPTYMWNSFIGLESSFDTEAQALLEATRIRPVGGFSILPVYF